MYNARRIIGALAGLLALLGLAAAAWFSVLLARADAEFRKGTPEGVARAVELAPRNTAYLSQHALQIEYEGGDSRPLLEEIARLNPDSSAPRIRLGLDAEVRGDLAGAERWLLEAARVDRQYEPRWTLANFYFRQRKLDRFWKWIRSALEVSYGDRTAAFDLAWAAAPDTRVILCARFRIGMRSSPRSRYTCCAATKATPHRWPDAFAMERCLGRSRAESRNGRAAGKRPPL